MHLLTLPYGLFIHSPIVENLASQPLPLSSFFFDIKQSCNEHSYAFVHPVLYTSSEKVFGSGVFESKDICIIKAKMFLSRGGFKVL